MKINYTVQSAAAFLLEGNGLSEWQISFLAVALDEVAEHYQGNITEKKCINELVQMDSQHKNSIKDVVYTLTGGIFELSWVGEYGLRTFTVLRHEKCQKMPLATFNLLHEECGWGSDTHRINLGALVVDCT